MMMHQPHWTRECCSLSSILSRLRCIVETQKIAKTTSTTFFRFVNLAASLVSTLGQKLPGHACIPSLCQKTLNPESPYGPSKIVAFPSPLDDSLSSKESAKTNHCKSPQYPWNLWLFQTLNWWMKVPSRAMFVSTSVCVSAHNLISLRLSFLPQDFLSMQTCAGAAKKTVWLVFVAVPVGPEMAVQAPFWVFCFCQSQENLLSFSCRGFHRKRTFCVAFLIQFPFEDEPKNCLKGKRMLVCVWSFCNSFLFFTKLTKCVYDNFSHSCSQLALSSSCWFSFVCCMFALFKLLLVFWNEYSWKEEVPVVENTLPYSKDRHVSWFCTKCNFQAFLAVQLLFGALHALAL